MEMIPNIKKLINEELERLNLNPEKDTDKWIQENGHVFFTSKSTKDDGSVYVFKARIADDHFFEECLKNDIYASLFFKSQPQLHKYVKFRNIYDWGLTSRIDWAVFEYMNGEQIEKSGLNDGKVDLIVKALSLLHSIDVSMLPPQIYFFEGIFTEIKFDGVKWWDNRYERYYKIVKQVLSHVKYEKKEQVLSFFQENYGVLRYGKEVVCHGDLDLNNIVVDEGKLHFIDWERIMVGNEAYDLANIFTRMSDSNWRNKLVLAFADQVNNQKDFKVLFRMMVILQCCYKIYPASLKTVNDEARAMKQWYSWVEKALIGFDELLG